MSRKVIFGLVVAALAAPATLWAELPKAEQTCINKINSDGVKVQAAQLKVNDGCIADAVKTQLAPGPAANACVEADPKGKVAKKRRQDDVGHHQEVRPPAPSIFFTGDVITNDAAEDSAKALARDVFGADPGRAAVVRHQRPRVRLSGEDQQPPEQAGARDGEAVPGLQEGRDDRQRRVHADGRDHQRAARTVRDQRRAAAVGAGRYQAEDQQGEGAAEGLGRLSSAPRARSTSSPVGRARASRRRRPSTAPAWPTASRTRRSAGSAR